MDYNKQLAQTSLEVFFFFTLDCPLIYALLAQTLLFTFTNTIHETVCSVRPLTLSPLGPIIPGRPLDPAGP